MSKKKATQNLHINATTEGSWDAAITDAERQIEVERARIGDLERAIQKFRWLKTKGAPFPESSKEGSGSGS